MSYLVFVKTSVITIDNIENTAMNKNDKIIFVAACRLKFSRKKRSCDGSDIYCSSVCSLKETREVNKGTRNRDITEHT